jgi:hypothetical protein
MAKPKIIWSHKATIKLFKILDFYSQRNQSTTFSVKLYRKFKKELSILRNQPEIGIKTNDEQIRGLIVDEFILFYEATSEVIIIYTLWDSRQNPENLNIKKE